MFAVVCLQLIRQRFADSQPDHTTSMTIGEVKTRLQSQVLISGASADTCSVLSGEIRPMPRAVFEQLTVPAYSVVIRNSKSMMLESPVIKELYNDA